MTRSIRLQAPVKLCSLANSFPHPPRTKRLRASEVTPLWAFFHIPISQYLAY